LLQGRTVWRTAASFSDRSEETAEPGNPANTEPSIAPAALGSTEPPKMLSADTLPKPVLKHPERMSFRTAPFKLLT